MHMKLLKHEHSPDRVYQTVLVFGHSITTTLIQYHRRQMWLKRTQPPLTRRMGNRTFTIFYWPLATHRIYNTAQCWSSYHPKSFQHWSLSIQLSLFLSPSALAGGRWWGWYNVREYIRRLLVGGGGGGSRAIKSFNTLGMDWARK